MLAHSQLRGRRARLHRIQLRPGESTARRRTVAGRRHRRVRLVRRRRAVPRVRHRPHSVRHGDPRSSTTVVSTDASPRCSTRAELDTPRRRAPSRASTEASSARATTPSRRRPAATSCCSTATSSSARSGSSGCTDAALSDDTVATATSLTNHGTILSVPYRNRPTRTLPDGMTPQEAAERVAAGSLQLRPTIPTAIGHCCYIRRPALDLIGGFDEQFNPGYGEEVDFSQRAIAHGFRHVCADDVFTYHRGDGSFGADPEVIARKERHEAIVAKRYPWYMPWIGRVERDPSRRSPTPSTRRAGRSSASTVGVDALSLGPDQMGTQQIVIETIRTLARRKEIKRLVVFVPPHLPPYVAELRAELTDVEFIGVNPFVDRAERRRRRRLPAVPGEPARRARLPARAPAIASSSTSSTRSPSRTRRTSPATQVWFSYRDLTRLTLELAHGVAFLSDAQPATASAEGSPRRHEAEAVVSCGIDEPDEDVVEERPRSLPDGRRRLPPLRRRLVPAQEPAASPSRCGPSCGAAGWRGRLVLAGPTPPDGNSLAREAEFLLRPPDLRPDVVTLGVGHRGREALAVPSTPRSCSTRRSIEGFGLVPFEAAAHGVPDAGHAAGQPGRGAARRDPGARRVRRRCRRRPGVDAAARRRRRRRPRRRRSATRGRSFTWDATAERLIDLFQDVLRRPRGQGARHRGRAQRHRPRLATAASRRSAVGSRAVVRRSSAARLKQGLSPDGSRRQRCART